MTARSGDEDTYSGKPIDAGTHPEEGSFLILETIPDGKTQYLSYHISEKAYDRAKAAGADLEQVDESEPPPLLAEYCYSTRVLTTYPTCEAIPAVGLGTWITFNVGDDRCCAMNAPT